MMAATTESVAPTLITLKDLASALVDDGIVQSKAKAEEVLKATFAAIESAVTSGTDVRIHGFGTFKLHKSPAHKGRNPQTGGAIDIPESESIKFKQSKSAKA